MDSVKGSGTPEVLLWSFTFQPNLQFKSRRPFRSGEHLRVSGRDFLLHHADRPQTHDPGRPSLSVRQSNLVRSLIDGLDLRIMVFQLVTVRKIGVGLPMGSWSVYCPSTNRVSPPLRPEVLRPLPGVSPLLSWDSRRDSRSDSVYVRVE